tara:strand:- start:1147 stop:3624 length:2478 start_codon:yes stop_codon:yes gene_type:complete
MLSFDSGLTNALKNANTTAFWVLKLYYNDESAFIGVSDRHRQDGTDIYYGLVTSWGTYRQSLDFFNFTTSIGNMGVTLINTENSIKGKRFSDLLATNNFANRKWELFLNTNETATLDTAARMIASGVISGEISYDENSTTLTLFDNTTRLHKKIPANKIDSATYTNAPENNIGKPIPMAFGDFSVDSNAPTSTTEFDRHFTKGKFPAIISDEWNATNARVEAIVDGHAISTLNNKNIYGYKSKLYFPVDDANATETEAGPATISFKGGVWYVYLPLKKHNTYITGNYANEIDGDFTTAGSAMAVVYDNANVRGYRVPKITKLGSYTSINLLIDFKSQSGTPNPGLYVSNNSGGNDIAVTWNGSDQLVNIAALFGATARTNWDFESDLFLDLDHSDATSGTASFDLYEMGIEIGFTPDTEKTYAQEIQETYEKIIPGGMGGYAVRTQFEREDEGFQYAEETTILTRTTTKLTPSIIDYIYCSGKGRLYGAYIDADSRDQGYTKAALIENPIFMIENIIRSELGVLYSGSATSTTSNKLVDSNAAFATSIVGQTLYNQTDKTSAMVTARDSATTLSIGADIMASGESYIISGLTSDQIDYASFDASGDTSDGFLGDIYEDAVGDVKFAFSQYRFINSKDMLERLGKLCLSYVFIGGDGKFKIKTLRRTDDYSSVDQTVDFYDINLEKIGKTSIGTVKNSILVRYNHDYGSKQNKSEATATDSTSQGTTVNGYNQTMRLEMDANEIIDSTTATKLAAAYLEIMKDRKDTVNFNCARPKYNHLEIGDIIDFSNWSSTLKVYGAAMTGYFIVADITKTVNGCSIKAIKVS